MDYEKAEYELQLFNFSVEQMKLENRFMVKKNVEQITSDFAGSLVKKSNISNEKAEEIHSKTEVVSEKIMEKFEGIFEEMDGLMERYFSIPENVLLAEDSKQEQSTSAADEEYYKAKVEEQENMVKQNVYLLTALGKELESYEKLQPALNREQNICEKLDEALQLNLSLDEPKEILSQVQEVAKKSEN